MPRVLSGIQPSGALHLGNYFGALKEWVRFQDDHDAFYCIVDLHALTVPQEPALLARRTLETAAGLLAVGLDPARCTLFVQSHVPAHTGLSWLLECVATVGELNRMTQYKDKGRGDTSVSVGLFTYPVLMAADILVYRADLVPVGEDQRQHLELTRRLAERANHRFGSLFVVPEAIVPPVGARVMDLQNPNAKMSKSSTSALGTIYLSDEPDVIERKVRRSVTDSLPGVTYEPDRRKGLANLLELFAAATETTPEAIAERYDRFGPLKADLTEALVALLAPLRSRFGELLGDPGELSSLLQAGAERAAEVATTTLADVSAAMGLLPSRSCSAGDPISAGDPAPADRP